QERSGSGIGKSDGAGCATITAGFVAVVTEFLNGFVVALAAGHGLFPLEFCGEKAENNFGSEVRLTPRFGLAPLTVTAANGALTSTDYSSGGDLPTDCLPSIRR